MSLPQTVLIVDDQKSLVRLGRIILQQAGYDVRGATSGAQALQLTDEFMPDVIILDLMMPDMGGREVCRQIRQQQEETAVSPLIIIYTADSSEEARLTSLEAGADDVLTKEVTLYELAEHIKTLHSD